MGRVQGACGVHVWWLQAAVPGQRADQVVIDLAVEGLHQAEVRVTLHPGGDVAGTGEVDPQFWWRQRSPGLGFVYGHAPHGTREVTARLRSGHEVTGATRFVEGLQATVFALPVPVQEPGWDSLGVVELRIRDAQGAVMDGWARGTRT